MCPGMTDNHEQFHYVPLHGTPEPGFYAQSLPFDTSTLSVIGTDAICEVDKTPTANVRPNMSIKVTQYLRLSDESLIRLDMDRGVTSVKHGISEVVSWKRSADNLIAEILTLVQVDDADRPGEHPWDELAETARKRGIDVDEATLRELPYRVLLTEEVITLLEL